MTTQPAAIPSAPQARDRATRWLRAAKEFILHAIVQGRVLQRPYPGIMHFLIFWGTAIQVLGTAINLLQTKLFLPFELTFPRGTAYLWFELVMDIAGLMIITGVLMALFRRIVLRPKSLVSRWDDWLALVLLLLIPILGFSTEAIRLEEVQPEWRTWSPIGNLVALWFTSLGLSGQVVLVIHPYLVAAHALSALSLAALIPFTKFRHLITGPLNIVLRPERKPGSLSASNNIQVTKDPTVGVIGEFPSELLLSYDACVQCGRCETICPATLSGMHFNPRTLVRGLFENMRLNFNAPNGAKAQSLYNGTIQKTTPWYCATCGACTKVCPMFIDPLLSVVELRRSLVMEGEMDYRLQEALANLGRYGNSFGQSERARAKWTQPIQPAIKDARREAVEFLWFVGDYASYNASAADVSRKAADVFRRAGLDFGILYDAECNAGNDARRAGEEGLFEMLREKNFAALGKCDFKAIVTTDPHSYNTLKNEYGSESAGGLRVLHHSELIDQLITSGQLRLSKKLGYRVTYHDPCYLGRFNGVYGPPRRVIEATGCQLIEMPRNREQAFCCSAGGGRIWMEEPEIKERPSEARIREAMGLDDLHAFIVACPKDVTMYQDALKTTGFEDRLVVRDLIELVHEAM